MTDSSESIRASGYAESSFTLHEEERKERSIWYRGMYTGAGPVQGIGMDILLLSGFQNQEWTLLGISCVQRYSCLKSMGYMAFKAAT